MMVTVAPRLAAAGANFAMAGAGMTVKLASLVPVPPEVVTAMRPAGGAGRHDGRDLCL